MSALRTTVLLIFCVALQFSSLQRACAGTYAERIVSGFGGTPMLASYAPGDPNRLFVGGIWNGEIKIVDLLTRTVRPEPFLVLSDLKNPFEGMEQGFLGLVFDPNYASNGYFYVNFTAQDNSLIVRRYRVLGDPATSNVADPASAHTILQVPKSTYWHNAGWIDFGPNDGFLYMSIGSPGATDGQDIEDNLHGSILRLDVRGDDFPADPTRNYAIPPSNPFVGRAGDDETWAFGLRNPFRASFDRLTGDLWINDTGENEREEVNFQTADSPGGENYGWPRREGSIEGPNNHGGPLLPEYTDPVYDYPHSGPDPLYQGSVISAGGLYRGPVDAFFGHYFFSDFGSRHIWKLDPDAVDPRASVTNVKELLLPDAGFLNRAATFGEDALGNMYLMDYDAPPNGEVFRIATTAKDIVWNGNDASAGNAGNGIDWNAANNWTRDGTEDAEFVEEDSVLFAPGSSQTNVDLNADRMVAAVTFSGAYTLQNHVLKVLSGNVTVSEGVAATIDSTLVAETVNHSIRKLGPGTLIVNGDAGQISVKEGTLSGNGTLNHLSIRDGAAVNPGTTIGTLNVEDSFRMDDDASIHIELSGTAAGQDYDRIIVGGNAVVGGELNVVLSGGFSPASGDSFDFLSAAGGVSGTFSNLLLPQLADGLGWRLVYEQLDARLLVQLSGDYNSDGHVDAADYVVWRKSLGSATETAADGNLNGIVDGADYGIWRANFGAVAAESAVNPLSVPELGCATLLTLGALSLLPLVRRSRS